jgi:cytochrome b561
MMIRDTPQGYGVVTRLFHWLMALVIVAMFALGWWMVRLDYYSPYYVSAPDLHRSVGLLLLMALLIRWAWRFGNVHPSDDELSAFERLSSKIVHEGFYPLLAALMISGYFISTSDGRPIDIFGFVQIPSVIVDKNLTDTAGYIHRVLAYITMALATVHAAAALKHHVSDHSSILRRMWSGPHAP